MAMSVAQTIISYFFIKTNFVGIPTDQVPQHDPTEGLIWAYAVQILYNPILALVKSSVLIFMTRLFGHTKGVARLLLWINVANISQMVAVFFAIALQCLPVPFNWDPTIRGGRCVDRRVLYVSTASFNILTDLLIIGIPLYILKGLKIPRRTKIALFFVFFLGFLVTITSVVRLVLLLQGLFNLRIFSDATSSIGFVSSGIEVNLALVTASIPALWPFFRSRERGGRGGGLFTRKSVAPTQVVDEEKGIKSVGWDSPPADGRLGTNKLGRGGSRGGRRGSNRSVRGTTKPARGGKTKPIIRVRTDATELRSQSPRPSQEETMTNNGIMRISDIQREIDGIAREIAATGSGAYIERPSTAGTMKGGFTFASANTPPRPSTGGEGRKFAERYYSESVYPDLDYDEREIRDYNSDRFSRYGDRRFGVVTPKGTTPTAPTWRQAGAGRPF
ncbi:hypothetical protein QBC34DRAFT_444887 [Podospora aff. communis PSN243]|uniref:Rhodopsin domain-containing protein n=1 Tax=Podospora aff. communis PSN243 TaxID=3040156 RepID=A0AAV9H6A5_9PEZI|nr:hypothetical protein QBC34DRAFT_444887 [Podospora aff. communis PSN243]